MDIEIRPLRESELDEADRIFRLAFGTFVGLPEPLRFGGDTDFVRTRWRAEPESTFAAVRGGELLGSNFATRWGRFAFFGPLSVRPELWDQGIAQRLLAATMDRFAAWDLTHAGLFTFATSPKHLVLYQRHGFHPRFLTVVARKPVALPPDPRAAERFSALPPDRRAAALDACRAVTDAILPGLDGEREIRAVQAQALGDTLLLAGDGALQGFAVCHVGPGSEAGGDTCYVKLAAVRPGPAAAAAFGELLERVERFAAERGVAAVVAGVNTARQLAYQALLARGFRIDIQGVAMQRPNLPGFNRDDVFVLDDWR